MQLFLIETTRTQATKGINQGPWRIRFKFGEETFY